MWARNRHHTFNHSDATPSFHFRHFEKITLSDENRIHMCGSWQCFHRIGEAYTFHTGCYATTTVSFSNAFIPSIAYSYRPSFQDERLRANRIRNAATLQLQRGILKHLPKDIVMMVAENLVMEAATVYSEKMFSPLNLTGKSYINIDLTKDVYMEYLEIEGISYVKWLNNTNLGGKGQLIFRARKSQQVKTIYIAFDYLGIRRVSFESPIGVAFNEDCLPYWVNIRSATRLEILSCIHDVSSSSE